MSYKEFMDSQAETSEYDVPVAAVVPPPGDKVWNYVKSEMEKGPRWGFDLKYQEENNKEKGQRDGESGDKPYDDGRNSKI